MSRLRTDIQALRAIAVLLVIAYHVSPTCVTGGFIGVDVFFVISGYLITGQLVREVNTTGRIDLPDFYARRAQRLLPASGLQPFDDYLCQGNVCPPVIGNVIVYRDQLHLTSAYSKTLANALQKEMLAAAPHLAGLVSEQSR